MVLVKPLVGRLLGFWIAWWMIAYLVGAPVVEASYMGVLLSLQGFVGCAALSVVRFGSNLSALRFAGLGTAIGAAITTLSFQLLLLFVNGVSPLFFTAAIASVALLLILKSRDNESFQRTDESEIGAVLLAALISLALTTGWHLLHVAALGSALLIVGLISRRSLLTTRRAKVLMTFGIPALVGWWFRESADHVLLGQILWDGDNSIFQLLINTTERWGVLENVGASGQSPIIGYHWATFAWMAMLEGASSAAPWVTLQFVMPLVSSIIVAAMLWEIASSASKSTALRFVCVVTVMGLFFLPDGSVSLFVSDVWLIAFAVIVHFALKSARFLHSIPLLAILFASVLFGKRSTGVLVIAALLAVTIVAFFFRQRRRSVQFGVLLLMTLFVLVADQMIAILGQRWLEVDLNGLTTGAGRVRFEFISDEAFGYAGTFTGVASVLGALFVTLSIFFPQFIGLLDKYFENGEGSTTFLGVLGSVVVSALAPFVMTGEVLAVYFYSRHLGLVMGSILVLVVALKLFSSETILGEAKFQRVLLFAVLISGGGWLLVFSFLQGKTAIDWTIVKDAVWIPATVATAGIAVFARSFRNRNVLLGTSMVTSVIVGGMVAIPKLVDELTNQRIRPLLQGEFSYEDLDFPSNDVAEVGEWIRNNTPTESVIGSNYFCESRSNFNLDCSPQSWWSDWLNRANSADAFGTACQVETYEGLGRVQNYLLPSVSDRRFFIQGPGFSLGCSQPPAWITERINISESFARQPDKKTCFDLTIAGVRYFVVDRRTTNRTSWGEFAVSRLINDSFHVLELNENKCGLS